MKQIEDVVMLDTRNKVLYCFNHGRYIFDKEIKITIQQFDGEEYRFPMLHCKKHEWEKRTHYYWSN